MEAIGNTIGIIWGTEGKSLADAVAGNGIILSARKTQDGKTSEIPNGDGDTIVAILHDETTTLELDVMTASTSAIPVRGDTVEICGVSGTVLRVEEGWNTGKEMTFKVSAKKWALITPA